MNNKCLTIILILVAATLIPAHVSAGKNKTVFVLFDLSESTARSSNRQEYLEAFMKIVDIRDVRTDLKESFIQPGDVLIADIISDNSISGSTFPIIKEFRKFSVWKDNYLMYKKNFRLEKEEQVIKAEEILFTSKRKIMFTDILSSLRIAERVFKRFKREENILVIFSDMKEESAEYNFARERLTDKRIEEIIGKERSRGLPDLKGVKVYVAGARADDRRHFQNIQRFWMSYFKACGAILEERNYGRGFMGIND
ncbi:MAG: hypothetical protein IBX72_11475 [Nitrospirae bacterium]|nr:hypothetical protein [Nitrospirota bacterium]